MLDDLLVLERQSVSGPCCQKFEPSVFVRCMTGINMGKERHLAAGQSLQSFAYGCRMGLLHPFDPAANLQIILADEIGTGITIFR